MRTAIDLTALADNFSGIERYALNMARMLLENNKNDAYDLIFKDSVHPDFLPWKDSKNVRFHILKGCSKLFFNQWRLPCFLNRLPADRFLFFAFPMPVLLHKKHVWGTIHDMGCWDCPETMKRQMVWYFRLSYRRMARKAERIITISQFSKNRIREILGVPDEKMILAYCGVSDNFRARAEVPPEYAAEIRAKYHLPDTYYLCLSTLEPRKNLLFLLRAYLELHRAGVIQTPLVLAGRKGWKVDELLQSLDAERTGRVIATGFVDDRDLPAVYRLAKCFLFPSLYEGFGIPPLEAMAQGVPVISSDSSSLPEVLGDAAIYFHSNDAADLKKALADFERMGQSDLNAQIERGFLRSRKFYYAMSRKEFEE